MPVEILTQNELAVLQWMRANLDRLAATGDADCAVLIVGKPDNAEFFIQALEDDHHGFRPLGQDAAASSPPHTEIRVWGSLTA